MQSIQQWEDAFGKQIADNTQNRADLAAHYQYNPQRWRIYKSNNSESNRQFPEYSSVSQYNHTSHHHELKPASGETIILETAERFRYVVQYELKATFALFINKSLPNSDDLVRAGLYDGDDGWFLEHNNSHSDTECDLVVLRGGSEVYRKTRNLSEALTTRQARLSLETAWYDVTRQRWAQSYSSGGNQENKTIGEVSADDALGPTIGNQPLRFEVQADSSTSDLVLSAGSCALTVLGNGGGNIRVKSTRFKDANGSGNADTYAPVRAFRLKPGREHVNIQLSKLKVLSTTAGVTVDVLFKSFSSSNVSFSGDSWSVPDEWQAENCPIQTRTNINNIVNRSGTSKSTTDTPGGTETGFATLSPTTGSDFSEGATSGGRTQKTNIPERDIAVILLKIGAASKDVNYLTAFELDF